MLEAGEQRPGTMAVVIGLETPAIEDVCREASDHDAVVVAANINAPEQVVISGDPAAVERAGTLLKKAGAKRVLPLNVSGAFHSPLMEPAQVGLRGELEQVPVASPAFPIIANASAEAVSNANDAKRLLGDQLTSPVRWVESMTRAREIGNASTPFIEIGPGNVLSGLLRRIDRSAISTALGTADDIGAFLEEHG